MFITVDNDGTNRFALKRAFQWLSYHILVKIDLILEIPAVGLDLQAICHFLTPFLADSFGKRCSDAVE